MTDKEITEGNKLIAEFMDLPCPPKYRKAEAGEFGVGYYYPGELEYRTSWDWLMPVVEKIERIKTKDYARNYMAPTDVIICKVAEGCGKSKDQYGCTIIQFTWNGHRIEETSNTKIQSVWKACIKFIKWYNTQNKEA